MKLTIVAGARPNFMKIAPIIKAINHYVGMGHAISYRLVHTGQHYDKSMSGNFFVQLGIPEPHANLECGGGTQAEQTAAIMIRFEKEIQEHRPDMVIVVGDVTSTMACTITAKKCCIQVAHVEAGIRSGDMTMPEEINRIVTDSICDHFFTTTILAGEMLQKQHIERSRIHFVGNTMIDTLYHQLNHTQKPDFFNENGLIEKKYFLLTLHRPSNVDVEEKLLSILDAIMLAAEGMPVIFPVHPRTQQMLDKIKYKNDSLLQIAPQPYLQFIYLVKNAKGIITDSGGITEEATVLDVPCLTMRNSTERPETVTIGTNMLIGDDMDLLSNSLQKIINDQWKKGSVPELWDGKTAERIVQKLTELFPN
jgi:UDP-N-acetylglucosamine 2-epimerase (non-hydrolysing)